MIRPTLLLGFASVRVCDLTPGQEIEQVLMVRTSEPRRLVLGDRTGTLEAPPREFEPGACVWVRGRVEARGRLDVHELRPAGAGEYLLEELVDGPRMTADRMEADLRALVATVQCAHLRALLDCVFGAATETWRRFRDAPAAKHYHQAYRHGLLEHCLGVAQAVSAISATFGGVDRDVAVTGALLHDIGKIEAYTDAAPAIDLSDAGRLQGEIALGYYLIRRLIEDIDGFPEELAQAVGHIILSHHGALEHGSPVVPCTREATLVHMVDNLGGRLGSFDRLEKELAPGSRWSRFDRAIGSGAFFGDPARPAERLPSRPGHEARPAAPSREAA